MSGLQTTSTGSSSAINAVFKPTKWLYEHTAWGKNSYPSVLLIEKIINKLQKDYDDYLERDQTGPEFFIDFSFKLGFSIVTILPMLLGRLLDWCFRLKPFSDNPLTENLFHDFSCRPFTFMAFVLSAFPAAVMGTIFCFPPVALLLATTVAALVTDIIIMPALTLLSGSVSLVLSGGIALLEALGCGKIFKRGADQSQAEQATVGNTSTQAIIDNRTARVVADMMPNFKLNLHSDDEVTKIHSNQSEVVLSGTESTKLEQEAELSEFAPSGSFTSSVVFHS